MWGRLDCMAAMKMKSNEWGGVLLNVGPESGFPNGIALR